MQHAYRTEKIRNVVLLGHGGAGKTTLLDAMAYVTGATTRPGRVDDGTSISDYDKEEIKRQCSISTTVVPIKWEGIYINFLDTPGSFDFVGEVEEALSVADAAIIVVNGKAGVEVGTQQAWDYCEKYNLPRIIFVTGMDDDHASFRQVVEDLDAMYGKRIAPFHQPIRENEKFVGFVNVVKMAGRRFIDEKGNYEEFDIPDYSYEYLEKYREFLLEAVAETSEEYMDRYFEGDEFTYDEISQALRNHVYDCGIIPVMMGSGLNVQGAAMLLQVIDKYFPAPNKREISGNNRDTWEEFEANYNDAKPMTAKIFKTLVDPFIGKYSLVKVCSGVLRAGSTIYNVNRDIEEKIPRLYVLRGKEAIEVKELRAGDIGAISKLTDAATGDTLATRANPIVYEKAQISTPYTYMAYRAKKKGDEDKISAALARLMEEDLTLKIVNDKENRQTLIYGIGEKQLDVAVSKLLSRYKVDVELYTPKVAFRETILGKSNVQGIHKKQSGGHGQYGVVQMTFEPSNDLETPYVFEECVFGGAVPKNFFPAVEKGIQECTLKGPLAGYPVVGVKATLTDGKYHSVDSSEMSFKMATIQAFKKGFMEAKPVLLEPIVELKVIVPDQFTGDIMSDLNKRRGRIMGMNPDHKGKQIIEATVPMSELIGYSTDLRSMTGGSGHFSYEFSHYEQTSYDVQEKEVAARASERD